MLGRGRVLEERKRNLNMKNKPNIHTLEQYGTLAVVYVSDCTING